MVSAGQHFYDGVPPQNAMDIELCLRITKGYTALSHWMGEGRSRLTKCKVLAPLLAAEAMEDQFDIGGSQRLVA
jgi:hypothetical protein